MIEIGFIFTLTVLLVFVTSAYCDLARELSKFKKRYFEKEELEKKHD
ncbi:MAG: hypothetical protein ACK53X_08855 [Holosporales bacterium]|jgi:hypothetical protein